MYEKFKLVNLLNRIPPKGNSELFCKQIFLTFDTQDYKVPFNIFMFTVSVKLVGEPLRKLPMIFKIFDVHKCGKLGIDSIERVIKVINIENISHNELKILIKILSHLLSFLELK